jgi:hypothetical protein
MVALCYFLEPTKRADFGHRGWFGPLLGARHGVSMPPISCCDKPHFAYFVETEEVFRVKYNVRRNSYRLEFKNRCLRRHQPQHSIASTMPWRPPALQLAK